MSEGCHIHFKKSQIDLNNAKVLVDYLDTSELIAVLAPWIALEQNYNASFIEHFLLRIESESLLHAPVLDPWLRRNSPWKKSTLGQWIHAKLLTLRSRAKPALEAWNEIIQAHSGNVAEAYLARARLYHQRNQYDAAYQDLQAAIALSDDYPFLSKTIALLKRLKKNQKYAFNYSLKIAFLGSNTPNLIVDLLGLLGFRDGIDMDIYTCSFGNFKQDILDTQSALYAFKPHYVVIATYWRDAGLPAYTSDPESAIDAVVSEYRKLWHVLLSRQFCTIVQHTFDLPVFEAYGRLSSHLAGGRCSMLRAINQKLQHNPPENVNFLDLESIATQTGQHSWENRTQWYWMRQYPGPAALVPLANHYLALLRAALGFNKKALVLDLDNTLWGGIIGEDGLAGIEIGPPSAAGEAYQDFQSYLLELKQRGILLTICSKNNEADARLPFEQHDGMRLTLEDILVFKANWQEKETNLIAIAQELNIATDSLVFVDDNPLECQRIRQTLPEVAVVELPREVADFIPTLHSRLFFEALSLSPEDQQRHRSYRANIQRHDLLQGSTSLDSFLKSLDMTALVSEFNDSNLGRVTQLISRTNQFNLTTRRYRKDEVWEMMGAPNYWTRCFRLKDRYGDNGIVGVMIAERDSDPWRVVLWLMSCRVLGRGLEYLMMTTLVNAAREASCREIAGLYQPTAKNSVVADLYPRLGFCISETKPDLKEQAQTFFLDVDRFQAPDYFIVC